MQIYHLVARLSDRPFLITCPGKNDVTEILACHQNWMRTNGSVLDVWILQLQDMPHGVITGFAHPVRDKDLSDAQFKDRVNSFAAALINDLRTLVSVDFVPVSDAAQHEPEISLAIEEATGTAGRQRTLEVVTNFARNWKLSMGIPSIPQLLSFWAFSYGEAEGNVLHPRQLTGMGVEWLDRFNYELFLDYGKGLASALETPAFYLQIDGQLEMWRVASN